MGVLIPIYLFLLWNKIFFGHLFSRTLDFGMIDAPVSMNWDGGYIKQAADGIDNDNDKYNNNNYNNNNIYLFNVKYKQTAIEKQKKLLHS